LKMGKCRCCQLRPGEGDKSDSENSMRKGVRRGSIEVEVGVGNARER